MPSERLEQQVDDLFARSDERVHALFSEIAEVSGDSAEHESMPPENRGHEESVTNGHVELSYQNVVALNGILKAVAERQPSDNIAYWSSEATRLMKILGV